MKLDQLLTAISATVLLAGCTTPTNISVDHDPEADFFGKETYAWLPDPSGQPTGLVVNAFIQAIDTEMAARGFTIVDDNPDLELAIHAVLEERVSGATVNSFNYGWGTYSSWNRHPHHRSGMGMSTMGMSTSRVNVQTYERGTLILDMVAPARNILIWRGTAERTVNDPSAARELAPDVAAKLLEDFPPQ